MTEQEYFEQFSGHKPLRVVQRIDSHAMDVHVDGKFIMHMTAEELDENVIYEGQEINLREYIREKFPVPRCGTTFVFNPDRFVLHTSNCPICGNSAIRPQGDLAVGVWMDDALHFDSDYVRRRQQRDSE